MPIFRGSDPPSKTALAEQVYQDLLGHRSARRVPWVILTPEEKRLALRLRFHLARRQRGVE